ncbi:hypothetical protein, partial [Couchioplanes caeruleus]|uniref:hypothetical protein n=1 Tax=Couchioplanes caeruleus TaxID=56438 RepID=UPI001B80DFD1
RSGRPTASSRNSDSGPHIDGTSGFIVVAIAGISGGRVGIVPVGPTFPVVRIVSILRKAGPSANNLGQCTILGNCLQASIISA